MNTNGLQPVIKHPWDLSPGEAIKLQKELASRVRISGGPDSVKRLLSLDVSYLRFEKKGYGVAVLFEVENNDGNWNFTEKASFFTIQEVNFPYIPGLLSFREIPVLLSLCQKIHETPDIILIDGMGIAHPRRFGLASHFGLLMDIPSIGVGKSKLIGDFEAPQREQGSFTVLYDKSEMIGYVLRSRDDVKPVFISPGHKIGFRKSLDIVKHCCTGTRIPLPIKIADAYTKQLRKGIIKTFGN